jgi:hypothetical protein
MLAIDIESGLTEAWERIATSFGARSFKVMKENLVLHIEEEEGEMFKQAKQVFDEEELAQLGESSAA